MSTTYLKRGGLFPLLDVDRDLSGLTPDQRNVASLFPEKIAVPAFPTFEGLPRVRSEMQRYLKRLGIHDQTRHAALDVARVFGAEGEVAGFVSDYINSASSGTHLGGMRAIKMHAQVHGVQGEIGLWDELGALAEALRGVLTTGQWSFTSPKAQRISPNETPGWVEDAYSIIEMCLCLESMGRVQSTELRSLVRTVTYGLRAELEMLDQALRTGENQFTEAAVAKRLHVIREKVSLITGKTQKE